MGQKVIKINCVGFIFLSFPVCPDTRVTKPSKVGPERTHPRAKQAFQPKRFNEILHCVPLLQTCFGEDRTSFTLLGTAFQRALRVPHRALWRLVLSHPLSSVSTQASVRFLTAHIIERGKVQLIPAASYCAYFSSCFSGFCWEVWVWMCQNGNIILHSLNLVIGLMSGIVLYRVHL